MFIPLCVGILFFIVKQALALLEHLIKNGAERVIEDARDHLHRVRMLSDFNYYEGPVDKGTGGTSRRRFWCVALG